MPATQREDSPGAPATENARKVVVVGQGYVGLPVAVRASEQGFDVVGFDLDEELVGHLRLGESVIEDVPSERLEAALASGRYRASSDAEDLTGFSIAVISVPTPLRDGEPDLSYIQHAARSLAPFVTADSCVILESTTYPGTTEELLKPLLEEGSGLEAGRDFSLGYSPERIDPGNTKWTFETTPKVVSGLTASCLRKVEDFYGQLVDVTVPVGSPKEAELTKLLENTFRHVNIALVNELAMFASDLGIDVWEAIEAASTKPFGYMRFTPGPGVGGHCLPIDPSYLSWRVRQSLGHNFRFVELANDINNHMPDYVVRRLVTALNTRGLAVTGRRILILGLAYKKNTADDREAPSSHIIDRLVSLGADVVASDPHVTPERSHSTVARVECVPEELSRADVVVLLVDHDQFDLSMVSAHAQYVLDTRHCLSAGPTVEHL